MRGLCLWGPLWLLFGTFVPINCERHSLTYIYTALSKPVQNRGIHEFTAMGLLDTKMIDYFDSDVQEKVPKQKWMEEKLSADYWKKGTESRKSKQQWFKVNLDILKERMNQTDNDVHVLQWMHGCEADLLPDGKSLSFQRGIDMYSYDGNSFLYFDDAHEVWVAAAKEAEQTKRKWDEVQVLKDYTKGYLEKECLDWLSKFMDYGQQQLKHAAPPEVYMFASSSRQKSKVLLTCMATGFYPPDIVLNLKKDGRVLTERDGVMTTGIRPNQDDTYQRRDSLYILRDDTAKYSCEVIHAATNVHLDKKWDGILPPHDDDVGSLPIGAVVGGVIGSIVVVVAIVAVVLIMKKQKKLCFAEKYAEVPFTVSSHVTIQPCLPCVSGSSTSSGSSSGGGGSIDSINKKDPEQTSNSSSQSKDSAIVADDAVNIPLLNEEAGSSSGSSSDGGGSIDSIDKKDPEQTSDSSSQSKDSAIVADAAVETPLLNKGTAAGDAHGPGGKE